MKLHPGPMSLPVQALIGAIVFCPEGVELGAVVDVRVDIYGEDRKIDFCLILKNGAGLSLSNLDDHKIYFQGP
jgi:sporulation protein YlmC with PRC-barrel domain